LLGLSDAGLDGWGAPMVVAGLAAAAVVLPLFVLAERPLADLAWGGRCLVFANAGPVDADAEQGQGRDRVVLLGPLEVADEQEQQREAREAGTVLPEALAALTETPEGSLGWLGELARAGDYEYPVVLDHRFPPKAVCEWAAEVGPTCSWPRPSAGPASACSTAPSRATSRTTPPAPSSWSTS
jgi:hypothetical protein